MSSYGSWRDSAGVSPLAHTPSYLKGLVKVDFERRRDDLLAKASQALASTPASQGADEPAQAARVTVDSSPARVGLGDPGAGGVEPCESTTEEPSSPSEAPEGPEASPSPRIDPPHYPTQEALENLDLEEQERQVEV